MRVKNLFGEYEELAVSKKESRIAVEKKSKSKTAPKKVLQKVYARPEKKYYSITEVSKLFDVKSSLLRYWEEKFAKISPSRSSNGARRYTVKDIEAINTVHYFLKIRKWTIEGLKQHMAKNGENDTDELLLRLRHIKSQLVDINKRLESKM